MPQSMVLYHHLPPLSSQCTIQQFLYVLETMQPHELTWQ